jgi:hypothetical protein
MFCRKWCQSWWTGWMRGFADRRYDVTDPSCSLSWSVLTYERPGMTRI